jgi:hypothetical protein
MKYKALYLGLLLSFASLTASASCDPIADTNSATPDMPVTLDRDVEILTSSGGGNMYLGKRVKKGTKVRTPLKTTRVPKGEHVIIRYVDKSCGWTEKRVVFTEDIWKTIGQSPTQN